METDERADFPEQPAAEPPPRPAGGRKSASADAARQRMLARTRAMTARERMIRALALAEETAEILTLLGRGQP